MEMEIGRLSATSEMAPTTAVSRRNTILKRDSIVATNLLENGLFSKLMVSGPESVSTPSKRVSVSGGGGQGHRLSVHKIREPRSHRGSIFSRGLESGLSFIKSSPNVLNFCANDSATMTPEDPVMTSVDMALETVLKTKQKKREDMLAGVPLEFSFGQSSIKVLHEKRKKITRSNTFADRIPVPVQQREHTTLALQRADSSKQLNTNVSANFNFPKKEDFFPRRQKNDHIGYEWGLEDEDRAKNNRGTLCRSSYPVTEGLHREGTSVTKLKGQVPRSLDVSKVWLRRMDETLAKQMIPTEIAEIDLKTQENRKEMKNRKVRYL